MIRGAGGSNTGKVLIGAGEIMPIPGGISGPVVIAGSGAATGMAVSRPM